MRVWPQDPEPGTARAEWWPLGPLNGRRPDPWAWADPLVPALREACAGLPCPQLLCHIPPLRIPGVIPSLTCDPHGRGVVTTLRTPPWRHVLAERAGAVPHPATWESRTEGGAVGRKGPRRPSRTGSCWDWHPGSLDRPPGLGLTRLGRDTKPRFRGRGPGRRPGDGGPLPALARGGLRSARSLPRGGGRRRGGRGEEGGGGREGAGAEQSRVEPSRADRREDPRAERSAAGRAGPSDPRKAPRPSPAPSPPRLLPLAGAGVAASGGGRSREGLTSAEAAGAQHRAGAGGEPGPGGGAPARPGPARCP
ncbi:transmembrane protein 240 isoform X1 [Hylobates moloch]|uniref:transmembrane protein 240 isoform X1 n=1 Tax=Hylobates moloch TaxID=81572 RepID=UPI0013F1C7EA|nr:transmembrane protein 240 isoform X1 [Hylobates moloch]